MKFKRLLMLSALAGLTQTAQAHTGFHPVQGWLSGFVHPLMGLDHLLALLAVGLWAVHVAPEPRKAWRLPLAFMLMMALGGFIGLNGWTLPGIEAGIAASVMVLGLMIVGLIRLPQSAAFGLVGFFALYHGLSHGAEMARGTDFIAYAAGFMGATGLLHLAGILLGRRLLPSILAYRAAGALIGGLGVYLLAQAV